MYTKAYSKVSTIYEGSPCQIQEHNGHQCNAKFKELKIKTPNTSCQTLTDLGLQRNRQDAAVVMLCQCLVNLSCISQLSHKDVRHQNLNIGRAEVMPPLGDQPRSHRRDDEPRLLEPII